MTYTDSVRDESCGSAVIPSSACVDRICQYEFDASLLSCFSATTIKVKVTSIHPDSVYRSQYIIIGNLINPCMHVYVISLANGVSFNTA